MNHPHTLLSLDKVHLGLRPPGMVVKTSGSKAWYLEIHDHIKYKPS